MLYFSKLRIILVSLVSIFFIFIAASNFQNPEDSLISKKINLGLDLQGGSYLLLEIDNEPVEIKKLQNSTTKNITHMKNNLILSGLHFDLKDGHKSLVSEKMEKIFKHEEKIIRARVELEHDSKSSSHKDEFIAKGHLELKGTTITISTASDNINKSVDDLVKNSTADYVEDLACAE
mgnify:CR=1 FL=1